MLEGGKKIFLQLWTNTSAICMMNNLSTPCEKMLRDGGWKRGKGGVRDCEEEQEGWRAKVTNRQQWRVSQKVQIDLTNRTGRTLCNSDWVGKKLEEKEKGHDEVKKMKESKTLWYLARHNKQFTWWSIQRIFHLKTKSTVEATAFFICHHHCLTKKVQPLAMWQHGFSRRRYRKGY